MRTQLSPLSIRREGILPVVTVWVLLLAVFMSSFASLRPQSIFLTASDMLFMVSAVLAVVTRNIFPAPFGRATNLFLIMFCVLCTAILFSTLATGSPERALIFILQYTFAYILLPYLFSSRDEMIVHRLVAAQVLGLTVGLVISLYFYVMGTYPSQFVSGAGRLMGFAGGPNGQAALIAITLPLLCYLWLSRYWHWSLSIFCLAVMLYGTIATSSFNGLLANAVALVLFFVLAMDVRRFFKTVLAMVVLAGIALNSGVGFLPEKFRERVVSFFESGDIEQAGSYAVRINLIKEALDIVDDTIFLGIGADKFRERSAYAVPVHNTYLLLWTETGMIGMIAWIILISTLVFTGIMTYRQPEQTLIGTTAIALGLTFLVIAVSKTHMFGRLWTVPLFLAFALMVTHQRTAALERKPPGIQPSIDAVGNAFRGPLR